MPGKPPIEPAPGSVIVRVRVQPKASSNTLRLGPDGVVLARLTAPPVDGAANKALIEFLAKTLGVPKRSITLQAGATSRNKTIRIDMLTESELRAKISADCSSD